MKAARGLWFLEYFGHKKVSVLDGGIQAWKKAGYPVTTETAPPKGTQFKFTERREVLATYEDVLKSINDQHAKIVDTRSEDEYMNGRRTSPRTAASRQRPSCEACTKSSA